MELSDKKLKIENDIVTVEENKEMPLILEPVVSSNNN